MIEDPFTRFEYRRRQRELERIQLTKRIAELNAEGERDAIAVAQLRAIYPNGFPASDEQAVEIGPVPDAIEPPPLPPSTAAEMQAAIGAFSVKEMALNILREAAPTGLSATQIKGKAFLRYRKHINPNTLTVSLVRLKPKVRCEKSYLVLCEAERKRRARCRK